MSVSVAERLVNRIAERRAARTGTSRRGFLGGAALVGAALAVDPWSYLTRPASAYDSVCGADNTCAAGFSVFCCTINNGANSCPPDSFIGGWWKADNSSFCGGSARYYIDCNAFRDGHYSCHCNQSTCDQRLVACNQFRYGQCNTQIPYSNTGPVVCRVISCTPPWVQYGDACSSSAATDNNTATHSAPCLVGNVPVGTVESLTTSGNTVRVVGWAYDPDQPATSIKVAVYADGHDLVTVAADRPRPDLDSAKHIRGNHGFDIFFAMPNGQHEFRVYALNIGAGSGNPLLSTHTLTVNPGSAPIGRLDSATSVGDTVQLTGWAYDRDQSSAELTMVVYQDGQRVSSAATTVARPDVNAAHHIAGNHGFTISLHAEAGRHKYQVYAVNLRGGVSNPLIGTADLVVNPGVAPIGRLDQATVTGETVRLRGWAYDPDQPATEIRVAVYADGHGLAQFPTGVPRPDVDAAHHIPGDHGFDVSIAATPGAHHYQVYALNVGGGSGNPLLGSTSVHVPAAGLVSSAAGSVGLLEQAVPLGETVQLTGWATTGAGDPAEITVFVDGAAVSGTVLRHLRADLTMANGALGFDVTVAATPGRHLLTVYAANRTGPASLLGSRTVTVEAVAVGAR